MLIKIVIHSVRILFTLNIISIIQDKALYSQYIIIRFLIRFFFRLKKGRSNFYFLKKISIGFHGFANFYLPDLVLSLLLKRLDKTSSTTTTTTTT